MLFIEDALNYTNQTVGAFKKQLQRNNEEICPPNCPPEEDIRNQNLDIRNKNQEKRNNNLDCSFEQQQEENITDPALQDIVYRVITYLNKKAFKNFKPDTKKTIDLIKNMKCVLFTYNNDDPFINSYHSYFWRKYIKY